MADLPKVIVIVGPTASGKTDLSITLAKKINGEIVSADSRQVYKGLNLGTGKVTQKEMRGIPHHLLNVTSPKRVYAASHFVRDAKKAIAEISKRGNVPIICGGTGFYIDTLLGRMSIPEVPPNALLRKKLTNKTTAELFSMLKRKDKVRAQTIDKQNPVRLIRALEIVEAIGKVPEQKVKDNYETLILGLTLPQVELDKRIHTRLLDRLKKGMLKEATKLHTQGLSWKRMEDLGLEYRYMARYLQGKLSKNEMVEQLEKEIIRYSKRQMTWFKRHKYVVWVGPKDNMKVEKLVKEVLKD